MRIPLAENLGNAVPQTGSAPRPQMGDNAVTRAVSGLAANVQGLIADEQSRQRREEESLDHNAAATAMLDVRLTTKTIAHDIAEKVRTGEVDRDEAQKLYEDQSATAVGDTLKPLRQGPAASMATQRAAIERKEAAADVLTAVNTSRRQQFGADAGEALDRFGKLAILPNVDINETIAQASSAFPALAAKAGIPQQTATKTFQDWADNTRFNRAQFELGDVRRDRPGLDVFSKRLEDGGDLYGQLDPPKVVALRRELDSHKWQLDQAGLHAADKREKDAERAITQTTRQIESAVPLTAGAWNTVRNVVAGTSQENAFDDLIKHEAEVQQVLRMPLDQQEAYVQQREASLMRDGGTLTDKANLQRLRSAIDTTTKQLTDAPLLAAQRLYGRVVKPLDLGSLTDAAGLADTAAILNSRASTLAAMQQQYGDRVAMKPLLPQEASALIAGLNKVGPSQAADIFSTLRMAINDDTTYAGVMQQIAPDSPVKARAGMLAAMRVGVTLQSNVIRDDVQASSRKVAETLLMGESILNKTKGQTASDGRAHSLFIPDSTAFASEFVGQTKDLYRGRPAAQETDLQVARAYYVGKAAQTGATLSDPKSADAGLMKEAITATVGSVVDFNGHGSVTAPIGMAASTFETKVRKAATEAGVRADELSNYGLQNYRGDGSYVMTLGGVPVVDPRTRAPVVLDLVSVPGLARYRPAAFDLIPK